MRIKSRNRRSTEKEEDELSDLFLIIFCARISINNNITNSLSLLLHFFCYLSLLLLLVTPPPSLLLSFLLFLIIIILSPLSLIKMVLHVSLLFSFLFFFLFFFFIMVSLKICRCQYFSHPFQYFLLWP